MKTAITSNGKTIDSMMDKRFGRCPFFCIFDDETSEYSFHKNPGIEARGGAGPMAVQFLAELGVEKVIAAEFGGKVKGTFDELKIQTLINQDEVKIEKIIESLKK